MPDWLTSAINGAGSALGSWISSEYNRAEAEKQRDWNEQMMDKQNAWNLDMWNKTNEYNSPVEKIKRIKEAGLNPLNYGLDGSAANNVQSAQALGYDRAQMNGIENPIMSGLNAATQIAQISNVQANTAKTNNENLTETQRRENMQAELLVTKQKLQNMLAEEDLTNTEKEEIEKRLEWTDRLNEATIAESQSRTNLNNATRNRIDKLLKGEINIQIKTLEDFDKKWAKIDAEIEKISAETGIAKLDIENYALNHLNNGVLGTGLSLNNLLRSRKGFKLRQHPKPQVIEGNPIMHGNSGTR